MIQKWKHDKQPNLRDAIPSLNLQETTTGSVKEGACRGWWAWFPAGALLFSGDFWFLDRSWLFDPHGWFNGELTGKQLCYIRKCISSINEDLWKTHENPSVFPGNVSVPDPLSSQPGNSRHCQCHRWCVESRYHLSSDSSGWSHTSEEYSHPTNISHPPLLSVNPLLNPCTEPLFLGGCLILGDKINE